MENLKSFANVIPQPEPEKDSQNLANTSNKAYFTDKENKLNQENSCPICGGSGLILKPDGTGKRCGCLKGKLLAERIKKSEILPALTKMTFANFNLAYYPSNQKPQGSQYINKTYYDFAKNAKKKAEEFVKNIQIDKNIKGLLFQGPVGSGKTHLAAATANALIEFGIDPLFLVVPDFLEEMRASYGEVGEFSEIELMARAKNAEVLILDDLGSHNFSEWTQNKIFSLLNYRLNYELPCLVTTNLDFDNLNRILGPRIVSRLIGCCEPCLLPVPQDIRLSQSRN